MSSQFAELLQMHKATRANEPDAAASSDSDGGDRTRGPPLTEFKRLRKRQDKRRTVRMYADRKGGRAVQGRTKGAALSATEGAPGSLALLFIIIDELPHEAIWRRWLASTECGGKGCRVLIQAKHPERVSSDWVRAHLIGQSFRPEWGSIELVRASLALLAAAVDDPLTQRFAFASESCIPIRPLAEVVDALWASEKSWLHAWSQPQTGNEQHNQNAVDSGVIPRGDIWKSDQWVMLTRKHAEAVLALPTRVGAAVWPRSAVGSAAGGGGGGAAPPIPTSATPALWPAFSAVFAADELYYATALSLLGFLFEPAGADDEDAVERRMLTYVDWPRPRSGKSPRTYESLEQFVRGGSSGGSGLCEAQRLRCLFARKFPAGSVDLDEWCVLSADLPALLPLHCLRASSHPPVHPGCMTPQV